MAGTEKMLHDRSEPPVSARIARLGDVPEPVAFLGPHGTFTDEAAQHAAPDAASTPLADVVEVIEAVRSGRCPTGIVPLENSIEGSVTATLDELAFGPPGVLIRGELTLPVSMHLMAAPGVQAGDIRVVRSHPHALAQVRGWLRAHLPGAVVEPVASTAEAARQAGAQREVAAVGNRVAAQRYGLVLLASELQDHDDNETRFAVLGRTPTPPTGADRTSVVVFLGPDHPGQLMRVLDEFASRGVNLSWIQSRPTKRRLGEYCIFIDCIGHLTTARIGEAVRALHRHVLDLRVLGSYPRYDGAPDAPAPTDDDAAYERAARWYTELVDRVVPRDSSA